jgi:hypothetical protein
MGGQPKICGSGQYRLCPIPVPGLTSLGTLIRCRRSASYLPDYLRKRLGKVKLFRSVWRYVRTASKHPVDATRSSL